ncbi:MAG TPA: hypothetical protein VGS41_08095, partial [Chthonomonadales bacterium]|nr:hypothetical protein [Chthonomonadales bacterium]
MSAPATALDPQIRRVRVGGFDLDGVLRGKYLSREKYLSVASSGFGFCDVIFGWDCADNLYDKGRFTGWHTGFPDLTARIDASTLRQVSWEPGTALALADFYDKQGAPLPICPRQLLKRVTGRAADMGFEPKAAVEYEFFLFEESAQSAAEKGYRELRPESTGNFCYSLHRTALRSSLVIELMESLDSLGIELEGLHTETGPGAFEAAIRYSDPVAAADHAGLFKATVKEICARHGLLASFMARWSADAPGCGGHIHQSLWSSAGENCFGGSDG